MRKLIKSEEDVIREIEDGFFKHNHPWLKFDQSMLIGHTILELLQTIRKYGAHKSEDWTLKHGMTRRLYTRNEFLGIEIRLTVRGDRMLIVNNETHFVNAIEIPARAVNFVFFDDRCRVESYADEINISLEYDEAPDELQELKHELWKFLNSVTRVDRRVTVNLFDEDCKKLYTSKNREYGVTAK